MSDMEFRLRLEAERRRRQQLAQQAQAQPAPQANPDGTFGQVPEGFIENPATGQFTTREWMANAAQPSRLDAAVSSGLQGMSLGGFDEALGAAGEFQRERALAQLEAGRRDFPITSGVSEAAGAGLTALTYGVPATVGRGMLGAAATGAGIGAAEGLTYGALSGEGGIGERLQNAVPYSIMGAGAGFAAPFIMRGADAATRPIRDGVAGIVDRLVNRGSPGRANRALDATLRRAGMTPDDVAASLQRAMADGQPEFRVADALGPAGQRRLSGVARSGDIPAAEITDFLNQRQVDQPERLASFIEDAFGARQSAASTRAGLTAARGQAADVAYEAARQGADAVDVRGALAVIDDRIGPMRGSGVAGDGIDGKLAQFRSRLAAPQSALEEGVSARELSDFDRVLGVKQDVQDAIGAAVRAGRNNEARELGKLLSALDEALEGASDGYRAANDGFREASRVIGAVDEGIEMARPGQRATDTTARFSAMTPEQQAAARTGYADRLLARLEATAGEGNRARPLTSTKVRTEADAMATDPGLLRRRVDRENVMFETRNRALGGSRTADNMADIADTQSYDMGMIANLLSGRWGTAATQAAGGLQDVLTGMNPQTKQIIAEALLSGNADALRAAARQGAMTDAQKAIVEQIARIVGMQQGGAALVQ